MILVTGAAGVTGTAAIRALAARGAAVRAFVSREGSGERVHAAGAREMIVGDLRRRDDLQRAMRGVAAVYHVCPNMSDAEVEIGAHAIAEAKAEGVRRFVYHSVIAPQIEAMAHHWDKLRVEAMLIESALAYTILQPAVYMQNVGFHWPRIVEHGEYPQPYSAQSRLTLVDVEDVAQAAARVLTETGWEGGSYELCSADTLDRNEMCAVLSEVLGRPVRPTTLVLGERPQADRLAAMFAYYDRRGLAAGNPRALEMLLGRPPTGFRAFVERLALRKEL